MKKIESLTIIGRRWFQKSCGNTYHSVTIYVNGEILRKDFEYGYGSQYIQTAAELLINAGYDIIRHYPDGTSKNKYSSLLEVIRSNEAFSEGVIDVARKRDL